MIKDLDRTLADLQTIASDAWITQALSDALPNLSRVTTNRYEVISDTTRYSDAYLGATKPSGRYRAGEGGDPGYALDTGRMISDLLDPFVDAKGRISIGSDAAYAGTQERLLRRKFGAGDADYPSFLDDEGYADVAIVAIGELFEDF